MKVAAMSPFLKISENRPVYKRMECISKEEEAPGSASPNLRCLNAYPMVEGRYGEPTPLRVRAAARLLVDVPPATWGWCASAPGPNGSWAAATAVPERQHSTKDWYKYSSDESVMIWMASTSYQGQPSAGDE